MPANTRGWAICRTWSGTVTIAGAAQSVDAFGSAWSQAETVTPAGYSWSLSSAGRIVISRDSGANFTLAFSGTNHTKMGFSSASYSGASSYTAEAVAPGCRVPYASDAAVYTETLPHLADRGHPLTYGAARVGSPQIADSRPVFRCRVVRAEALAALDDWSDYLETPAQIDVAYGDTPTIKRYHVESMDVRHDPGQVVADLTISMSEVY